MKVQLRGDEWKCATPFAAFNIIVKLNIDYKLTTQSNLRTLFYPLICAKPRSRWFCQYL